MRWLLLIAVIAVLAVWQIQPSWSSDEPDCTTNPTEFVVLPSGTEAIVSSVACTKQ